MNIIGDLSARLPFSKKPLEAEYFFALNIGPEKLTASLWTIEGDRLKVLNSATSAYQTTEEITKVTDQLLDSALGDFTHEPQKILFGVQDSWLVDDDLREPYLKILRTIVKELELTPMAYVATSHAIIHFLEKAEGSPTTAILVGIGKKFVSVINVRSGKLDGVVVVERGGNLGTDIEKAILTGVKAEVLPSKILIYGDGDIEKQKGELLAYPWMSKLSFLHFPKIEVLSGGLEIKSICLAGAVEINPDIKFDKQDIEEKPMQKEAVLDEAEMEKQDMEQKGEELMPVPAEPTDLGFMAGDIAEDKFAGDAPDIEENPESGFTELENPAESIVMQPDKEIEEATAANVDWEKKTPVSFNQSVAEEIMPETPQSKVNGVLKKLSVPSGGKRIGLIVGIVLILLIALYILLPQASVKIFVEPRILEKEAQVIADPDQQKADEEGKKIPGKIIETQISGSGSGQATGKKQIGDPAKGVVIIRNKTAQPATIKQGTTFTASNGLKFTLDSAVTATSSSSIDGTWGKATGNVTAVGIGPDSNLVSGADLTISGYPTSELVAITEGNFSGGTSKDVTVVTSEDQQKLLASVASDLRKKAQEELQNKLNSTPNTEGQKVLQETLTEEISKKTFNKNVNDQASEFSLNLAVSFKGTAFNELDLKTIVAKLVETNVPDGFMLDLSQAETQADVTKVEKDGKVTFTARFRAKLMPKIDTEKIRSQLVGKDAAQAADILRTYENILGSDIKITPSFPGPLQRLPLISKNIKVEVGLK